MLSGFSFNPVQSSLTAIFDSFPVKKTTAYFNNASYTPMSRSALDAIHATLSSYSSNGPSDEYYKKMKDGSNEARAKLGRLLNVDKEGIVFTESATQSINLVANGFKFKKGDALLIRGGTSEHPSNYLPWIYYAKLKGVNVVDLQVDRFGRPDLGELDSILRKTNPRLVTMSHILYNLGTTLPSKEIVKIVHENGCMFFLDASQSIGSTSVDLKRIDCDYACGTAAKWLCGPLGLGFFYCRDEALDMLEPLNFGANACNYRLDGTYDVLPHASRLQEGFRNWAYVEGLSAAIDLIESFGAEEIRNRNLKLSAAIISSLLDLPEKYNVISPHDESRSSIVAVECLSEKPIEIVQRAAREGLTIAEREVGEKKILRISPHFYNDEGEVEKLIRFLKS